MELQYSEVAEDIRLIKLIGRLDISGVSDIENEFSERCAGEQPRVIVDLSEVDFLASIGIRLLTLTAKTISGRGGRMVLLRPRPDVRQVLEITGISAVIPVHDRLESAQVAVIAG
jgi:anti-anti-sigma factor